MSSQWPTNWSELIRGVGCEMCESDRPDSDKHGIRIKASPNTDAVLQRANVQRGYTLVIWRGRHVTEPTELTDEEGYAKLPMKMIKKLSDLRRHAADGTASEGFA